MFYGGGMNYREVENLHTSRHVDPHCPFCPDMRLLPPLIDAQLPTVTEGKIDTQLDPSTGELRFGGLVVAPRMCMNCGYLALFSLKALELHHQPFFDNPGGKTDPGPGVED